VLPVSVPPQIEVRILDPRINQWGLPRYQSEMAAGVDLHACIDEALVIEAQAPAVLVSSGIAVHIADVGFVGLIVPRSGLGHRVGLVMGNLVGVLDADYRGTVFVSLWNRNAGGSVVIEPGDRIAQLLFLPVVRPEFHVVEAFTGSSERADRGFGSTGNGVGRTGG